MPRHTLCPAYCPAELLHHALSLSLCAALTHLNLFFCPSRPLSPHLAKPRHHGSPRRRQGEFSILATVPTDSQTLFPEFSVRCDYERIQRTAYPRPTFPPHPPFALPRPGVTRSPRSSACAGAHTAMGCSLIPAGRLRNLSPAGPAPVRTGVFRPYPPPLRIVALTALPRGSAGIRTRRTADAPFPTR